ncbi:molybdopterin cofactor-binding domain-containing protein [Propylenella binzhouense]|uniref:molybdopterin cofactor-binding domain-containing protein n=1 Tax=Propylenella binzhouense TaxID=2555902 RepID=UPI00136B679C
MTAFGVGSPVRRIEDDRFVRGRGHYTDDLRFAGECFMAVVRSPHASAAIGRIDAAEALAAPGVVAVLTGRDAEADGIGGLVTAVRRRRRDGSPMAEPPYRALAVDRARFVGDAVAIVLAETAEAARDAAERVAVEYEELPAVTDAAEALAPGAPAVWPDLVPDNEAFVFEQGDRGAVDRALAAAAHVARLDFRISRVSANTLEPRNAIGLFDPGTGRYTLHSGTQSPHRLRLELAEHALFVPQSRIRVVAPDIGGAFGMKGSIYPEQILVLWAARRVGRPVRWQADRSESFLSDHHARDNLTSVELGLDGDGRFLALRVRTIANLGAYLAMNTPHSPTNNLGGLAGTYRTPAIHAEVIGVHTNTQPTAPYRGAGRPEATYAIERIIDVAAAEFGFDRIELRRRNMIRPSEMPYRTGLVFTYDCGDFPANMERALALADFDGFAERRRAAAERGRLLGLGIANPIEIAGGPEQNPGEEACEIRFDPSGGATILLGTHNHGQGHETAFRQVAHELLGLAPDRVEILYGDTDAVPHGKGTFGSRSIAAGGTALARAAGKIVARGREIAARLLEADPGDIEFAEGRFRIAGTDRSLALEEVARASFEPGRLPPSSELGLIEKAIVSARGATFPNGCHVCEAEVDPESGEWLLTRYTVVEDVGRVVNPLLVKGQVHGGVAQGFGQVAGEAIRYDAETGQLVTASFQDYRMPRAIDFPDFALESNEVPTAQNALGVKGAGEAGAVGALSAVTNAVLDALAPLGIRHLDMPLTPEQVWRAIRAAEEAGSAPQPEAVPARP